MQDERRLIHRELVSDRPFEGVVAAFEGAVGTMEGDAFRAAAESSTGAGDFEERVRAAERLHALYRPGPRRLDGPNGRPARARLYIVGNPLIAWTMLQHDLRAGLHVPVVAYW